MLVELLHFVVVIGTAGLVTVGQEAYGQWRKLRALRFAASPVIAPAPNQALSIYVGIRLDKVGEALTEQGYEQTGQYRVVSDTLCPEWFLRTYRHPQTNAVARTGAWQMQHRLVPCHLRIEAWLRDGGRLAVTAGEPDFVPIAHGFVGLPAVDERWFPVVTKAIDPLTTALAEAVEQRGDAPAAAAGPDALVADLADLYAAQVAAGILERDGDGYRYTPAAARRAVWCRLGWVDHPLKQAGLARAVPA